MYHSLKYFLKQKFSLCEVYGIKTGYNYAVLFFFAGIALIGIIDKLVPNFENPHEMKNAEMVNSQLQKSGNLVRMGVFSALAIGIHNFPEGLATFYGALENPALGISIAVAIAIHNIPEGVAVAVPIYFATKSRKKAFYLSFLSGLAEPAGALIGFFILKNIFSEQIFGIVYAMVAGIMVYISLDELLPAAEKYGKHHIAIYSLILGMAVMAITLLLFN